jgi:hypothetical protein
VLTRSSSLEAQDQTMIRSTHLFKTGGALLAGGAGSIVVALFLGDTLGLESAAWPVLSIGVFGIYAGPFALLAGFTTMEMETRRAALRRQRGQCLQCGYDLRGTARGSACPECGGECPPE